MRGWIQRVSESRTALRRHAREQARAYVAAHPRKRDRLRLGLRLGFCALIAGVALAALAAT